MNFLNPWDYNPTLQSLLRTALRIQVDSAFYCYSDAASHYDPNFPATFKAYAIATAGAVPERVHDLAAGNVWGLPAGRVTQPAIYSGRLSPDMITDLNNGVPPAEVLTIARLNAANQLDVLSLAIANAAPQDKPALEAQLNAWQIITAG